MLKLCSRKCRAKVQCYILHSTMTYDEDWFDNFNDAADYIRNVFYDEIIKYCPDYLRIYKSHYNAFEYWCRELPTVLDCSFCCNISAVEVVGDLLEESEAERRLYSESAAEDLLIRLMYREIFGILGK